MSYKEASKIFKYNRQLQKNKIIEKLQNEGFIILRRDGKPAIKPKLTGSGAIRFTAGGKMEPHDLSNWKWIYARNEEEGYDVLILLQIFNVYQEKRLILEDRIGIYKHSIEGYNVKECFEKIKDTGIVLPIFEEDKYNENMEKLLNIIKKNYK